MKTLFSDKFWKSEFLPVWLAIVIIVGTIVYKMWPIKRDAIVVDKYCNIIEGGGGSRIFTIVKNQAGDSVRVSYSTGIVDDEGWIVVAVDRAGDTVDVVCTPYLYESKHKGSIITYTKGKFLNPNVGLK